MMNIKPIHSRADHKAALKLVSKLVDLDPAPGTPDGDMLEVMSTLIAAYEAKHFAIGPADPIEAIKFRMDQQGLSVADLEPMIGKRNRVYEVLARTRPLTLAMIRRLHDGLGIPAESLIRPMTPGS
jgi:HTH-type transcriptional regulator / antitoxin HigA